jgi:hypothetical protein
MTTITRTAALTPVPEPLARDAVRSQLGDARIKLAGSISEMDYRYLLELRRSLNSVARQLRTAASTGGMFPFEYRSGANDAARAAQLLGRANAILHEVNGEPTPAELRRIERRLDRTLTSAKFALDQAFIAAHTGTHP